VDVSPPAAVDAGQYPTQTAVIVGRIELAVTPPVWLDDVQVYPDVDKTPGPCRRNSAGPRATR